LSGAAAAGDPLPDSLGVDDRAQLGAGKGQPRGHVGADPRLAKVVFALLVLGCFAAFLVTQRLKHTPAVVQEFKLTNSFVPTSSGPHKLEAISFKLAKADEVTVTIENPSGEEVATLAHDMPVARYKKFSLRWNGREGASHGYSVLRSPHGYALLLPINRGRLAPAGEYRVLVSLRAQKRTVPSSRDFTLVRP
jgi:hypothetical protein